MHTEENSTLPEYQLIIKHGGPTPQKVMAELLKSVPGNDKINVLKSIKKAPQPLLQCSDEQILRDIAEVLIAAGADVDITNQTEKVFTPAIRTDTQPSSDLTPEKARRILRFQFELSPNRDPFEFLQHADATMLIQLFLAAGADVNKKDIQGNTLLHLTAALGNVELTRIILATPTLRVEESNHAGQLASDYAMQIINKRSLFGSETTRENITQCIRLIEAALEQRGGAVQEIRKYIQDVINALLADPFCDLSEVPHQYIVNAAHQVLTNNLQVADYSSAVLNAAEKNDVTTLRLLVLAEADVNATTFRGKTALHVAAEKGYLQCVQILTQHKDIQINKKSGFSESTPLCLAAENGHTEIVKYLLSLPSICVNTGSPLQLACKNNHVDCVRYLLECPSVKTEAALQTALIYSPECTQLLLAKPETNVCKLYHNASALHTAAAHNKKDELWQMLNRPGINPAVEDSDGNTPLHIAALNGHADCLYYILKSPSGFPDVNKANKSGMTALHLAARMGYHECVATLLQSGPDINRNLRNNDGKTPLDLTQGFSLRRSLFSKSNMSNIQECEKLLRTYFPYS